MGQKLQQGIYLTDDPRTVVTEPCAGHNCCLAPGMGRLAPGRPSLLGRQERARGSTHVGHRLALRALLEAQDARRMVGSGGGMNTSSPPTTGGWVSSGKSLSFLKFGFSLLKNSNREPYLAGFRWTLSRRSWHGW